jgi:hypothetical protein
MAKAAPILLSMHWNLILEERFLNCEGILSINTRNKRMAIWKALLEIDKSLKNDDIVGSLELYFVAHARSSDICKHEYELLCDLYDSKKMSYKWSKPKKFTDDGMRELR